MVFSLFELFDAFVITAFMGFFFMDMFKKPKAIDYDPLTDNSYKKGFDWDAFKFAALVTAPAILLHELAHKLVAISYGLQATFHAAYTWLGIGLVMKLLNFGFIFFVPAFVSHSGGASPFQSAMISGAGPFINLILFLAAHLYLKFGNAKPKYKPLLILTKRINLFLFAFNLIPIPGFDGSKFFAGLFATLF
jgi:Zn-dependent protease